MIIHGDVAFMIISTVLVLIMTPGLAFFYGGLVERRNSLTMMFQSFIAIGIVPILWIFGGFSLVFGDDIWGIIGNPAQFFAFNNLSPFVVERYDETIPYLLFFMYQMMFAIITAPLMTGAFANRLTPSGWIKILVLWMIFIYFPVAHWVWGGGFLAKMGFVDYAGGAVIHITAGFGCLSGVFFLGKRQYEYTSRPFSIGLVTIGTALLLFGWFGFNTGGALTAAGLTAIVFTNTGIAAASAMITWLILHYIFHKRHSFLEICVGLIAGFATVTPCSGYITPLSSVWVGIIGALVCFFCVLFERKRWDDSLDVWGVHGVGGFLGILLVGIFANPLINSISSGIRQFFVQLFGSVLIAIYSMVLTYVIFMITDKIGTSIRVPKEVQESGLDEFYFSENYTDDYK
ncbi:MAG: ammonium transporter [Cellulosilyticum sp.]|nr:ammonium transporter [Cellulosilyticum sp.]